MNLSELKRMLKPWIWEISPQWVHLTTPLTSTSWDGDAYSTTAKTKIDLSAVFGVPAGVKAIVVMIRARDSGSAAGTGVFFAISPNSTAGEYPIARKLDGVPNDRQVFASGVCPCDSAGDIYYQIVASGASTLDAWIEIWGYLL